MSKADLKHRHMRLSESDVSFQDFANLNNDSESSLFHLSGWVCDQLSFDEAKKRCSQPAYRLTVAAQLVGCVNSGGLAVGIVGNIPSIIPHVTENARFFGEDKFAELFGEIFSFFPDGYDFSAGPSADFCNRLNQLESHSQDYSSFIDRTEALVEDRWCNYLHDPWPPYTDYFNQNLQTPIWK